MKTYIKCDNKAKRDAVLKVMDKKGIRWISGGEIPSTWESTEWEDNDTVYLIVNGDDSLSWCYSLFGYDGDRGEMMSASEYLAKNNKCYPILIYRKGRTVTAEDKTTGDKGVAVCSPDDEFDFYTGAMTALCRLAYGKLGEDAKTEMRKLLGDLDTDEIKVGDRVTVVNSSYAYTTYATWFITHKIDNDIAIRYAYNSSPRNGKHCYVKAIAEHENGYDLYCIQEENYNDGINPTYLIGRDGIEKYED